LTTSRIYPTILKLKKQTLWVIVIVFCFLGTFALNNSPADLIAMSLAGILGFVLRKLDFPQGPMVLGLLLGRMLEANLRRSLSLTHGSYDIFVKSPICLVLLIITLFSLVVPPVKEYIHARREVQNPGNPS